MVEIIPFMLFVLKVLDDRPVQVTLERHPVVFMDKEECLAAAEGIMDDIAREASLEREDLRHWCLPIPERREFREMFDRKDAARVEGA